MYDERDKTVFVERMHAPWLEFWQIDNVQRPHDRFIIYGKLYLSGQL